MSEPLQWKNADGTMSDDPMKARNTYANTATIPSRVPGAGGLLEFYINNHDAWDSRIDAWDDTKRTFTLRAPSGGGSTPTSAGLLAPGQTPLDQLPAAPESSGQAPLDPNVPDYVTSSLNPGMESPNRTDDVPAGGARDALGNVYYPNGRRAAWTGPKGKPYGWSAFQVKQQQQQEEQKAFEAGFRETLPKAKLP